MEMFSRFSLDSQGNVTVGLKTHYSIFNIFLFIFIIIKMPFYSPSTLEIRRLRKKQKQKVLGEEKEPPQTTYFFFIMFT